MTGRPDDPLLSVRDLHTTFPIRSALLRRTIGTVQAVSGISFDLWRGETLGLVGESGSGKSTVARTIVGLERQTSGSISFEGRQVDVRNRSAMRELRREVQMIFQDPYTSLNPRATVSEIITEAWSIHRDVMPRGRWGAEVKDLLARVGLNPDHADRYPHQFSGGQRQRIGIARALALRPKLIVSDEAVSALDVSVQAQVLNLLQDLQREYGLTYLFIAHDLSVVRHISDRVAVMYLGKIVEHGSRDAIFDTPTHPYTQALRSAVPVTRPWRSHRRERILLKGDVPSPIHPPSGCRFRSRCALAAEVCAEQEPLLVERVGPHPSACHFARVLHTDPSSAVAHHGDTSPVPGPRNPHRG